MKKFQASQSMVQMPHALYVKLKNSLSPERRSLKNVLDLLHRIGLEAIEEKERIIDAYTKSRIDVDTNVKARIKTNEENVSDG